MGLGLNPSHVDKLLSFTSCQSPFPSVGLLLRELKAIALQVWHSLRCRFNDGVTVKRSWLTTAEKEVSRESKEAAEPSHCPCRCPVKDCPASSCVFLARLQGFPKLRSLDKHETCASQPWTCRSIQCVHDTLMLRVKYNSLCVKAYTYIIAENLNRTITFSSWKQGHSKASTVPTSIGCIGQRKPSCIVCRCVGMVAFSFLYNMHSWCRCFPGVLLGCQYL